VRIKAENGELNRLVRDLRDTGEFSLDGRRHLIERVNRNDAVMKFSRALYLVSVFAFFGCIGYMVYSPKSSETDLFYGIAAANLISFFPLFYSKVENDDIEEYVVKIGEVARQQRELRKASRESYEFVASDNFSLDRI